MNTTPDPRILATARLFENLAVLARQVRYHAAEQFALIDSYPTETQGCNPIRHVAPTRTIAGTCHHNTPDPTNPTELIDCGHERPCPYHDTPIELTPTERAAAQREHIRTWLEDFEDRAKLAATIAHTLITDGTKFIGTRPHIGPECRDGIHGKDLSPTLTADIATCTRHPEKSGLCARHYMAWYRERNRTPVTSN